MTTHALDTSDAAHRSDTGLTVLKHLDLGVLAIALPVFLVGGFPIVAYAIVAVVWIAQRLLQRFATARAVATGDRRAAAEVPLEAGILGVADAYEAMTAQRPYRPPLDPQAASDELRRGAGKQFDARVVDALLRVV